MKKKKIGKKVLVGSLLAVCILPTSVYASIQPLDLVKNIGTEIADNDSIRDSLEEISSIADTARNVFSRIGAGDLDNAFRDIFSLSGREELLEVSEIVSTSENIFRDIISSDIDGALDNVSRILGQLGLPNPFEEAQQVAADALAGRNGENPYANPQTPEEVYELQRYVDKVRASTPQKLSQVVFGLPGQQNLWQQQQAIGKAQRSALLGQQGATISYLKSARQARQNAAYAARVAVAASNARTANVSQDILKAIAAQNADLANVAVGQSAQLVSLGQAAFYQSAQLSAANVQLAALNDKAQTLSVLSAAQNSQAAQISAAIERQNHYQQLKDSLEKNSAYQASSSIFIPGLVPKDERQ